MEQGEGTQLSYHKRVAHHVSGLGALSCLTDRLLNIRSLSGRVASAFRNSVAAYRALRGLKQTVSNAEPFRRQIRHAIEILHPTAAHPTKKGPSPTTRPYAAALPATIQSLVPARWRIDQTATDAGVVLLRHSLAAACPLLRNTGVGLQSVSLWVRHLVRDRVRTIHLQSGDEPTGLAAQGSASQLQARYPLLGTVPRAPIAIATPDMATRGGFPSVAPLNVLEPVQAVRGEQNVLGNSPRETRPAIADTVEGRDAAVAHLDGFDLGQWVVNHLERQLLRPRSGMAGVDPRVTPL